MMITLNLTGMEMSVMNVSNNFKINGCGRYGYDCKKNKIMRWQDIRKYNLFGRKYFTKDNTINGSIKNTIIINTVNCCGYKIIINNYVDLIFIFLLLFAVIRSMDNLKQIVFYFCILLFLKYVWSVFIKLKIKFNNSTVGSIKHLFLSNTINILLNENKYEIYSHGGNYFSIR